jgi:condensation enzyme
MDQSEILAESATKYPLSSRQRDPSGLSRRPKAIVPVALRVKGELHVDSLKGALDDVVERQESLRTRLHYNETDGNAGFQEVLPPLPVPFTVRDIAVTPGRSREEMAIDLVVKLNDATIPFDSMPSLRAFLHRFDDHDAVLILVSHHLFSDGWSASILRREIAACYKSRVTGIPHALPTPLPYREFASWEQEFLQGEKGAAARRFWQGKLAGAEMFTMPVDRLPGPDTLMQGAAVGNFSIDPGSFARVVASAAQNRCSVWHVLLAAFMVLAEKVAGRSDITLLAANTGRPTREFYDTIGFFVNFVPLRLEFGNCASFRDLVLLARKASADALQHQLPFATVLELVPDLMNGAADPRAQGPIFNYQNYSPRAKGDTRFATSVEPVVLPEDLPTNLVSGGMVWTFKMVPSGEFRCAIEYESGAIDVSTIDRWGSDFIGLILAIADRPDQAWKKL